MIFLHHFHKFDSRAFRLIYGVLEMFQNLASQDKEYRDTVRKNAVREKELLKNLFEKKPTYDLVINKNESYLVNSDFMLKWRKYIR